MNYRMIHPPREPVLVSLRPLPRTVAIAGVLCAVLVTSGTAYALLLGCGGAEAPEPVTAPPPVRRTLMVSGAASSLTRLTQDPAEESRPVLSPDQHVLMFSAAREEQGRYTAEVIVSVDPATGARRTIYTPEQAFSGQVAWMPDGSAFVYRSNRSGPWALVRSLSVSPNSGVAIMMDENQAPQIGWPSVAPDGRKVAAHAVIAGTPSIITLDVGTSQYAILGEGTQPNFDATGERIAFARRVGPSVQLFTMRASDGTDLVQVSGGAFSAEAPCYSPDGRWIAFVSNRSSSSTQPLLDGTQNLFAIHPDGSGLTQLTDGNAVNGAPHWATDGFIYFSSNQTGNSDIWRLLPEGEVRALPPQAAPPIVPEPADGAAP